MRLAVFGLGYVGSVTAACLAKRGHQVVGVDVHAEKVAAINRGSTPVQEPDLGQLVVDTVGNRTLSATQDAAAAVAAAELVLICVGTPSDQQGALDISHVMEVGEQIGRALVAREAPIAIVLRSTVLPGTTREHLIPCIEAASGRKNGLDFDVSYHPEFLREGSGVADFFDPPKIVIGTEDGKPNQLVQSLYEDLNLGAPIIDTTFEVAEMAKYVDNSWHALKVVFANEMARIAKSLEIDSRDVMSVMVKDLKLNISQQYLKPGFAYGGSCLPKDLSALTHLARQRDIKLPLLYSIDSSNQIQVAAAADLVARADGLRVGVLGVSFKPQTDDVRNSPVLILIRMLLTAGHQVIAFDPNIDLGSMLGANREFLLGALPEIEDILVGSAGEVISRSDTLVLTKLEPGLVDALADLAEHQTLIDLVGLKDRPKQGRYVGIGW